MYLKTKGVEQRQELIMCNLWPICVSFFLGKHEGCEALLKIFVESENCKTKQYNIALQEAKKKEWKK
jgi:hypothetical protein